MIRTFFFATAASLSFVSGVAAQEVVAYDREELSDAAYQADLYERIEEAAERACRDELQGEPFGPMLLDECIEGTVDEAIDQVDSAELTAYATDPSDLEIVASSK